MRCIAAIAILVCSTCTYAQAIDWKAVDARRDLNMKAWPRFYNVTKAEQTQMRKLITPRTADCAAGINSEFQFNPQPLAPGHRDFFVAPMQDCPRSGQDGNNAQWIVEFTAGHARVLGEVDGNLSHLEPAVSHGLHDIVMSVHTGGACCYTLSYYRYDGKEFHRTGAANVAIDEQGKANITPK